MDNNANFLMMAILSNKNNFANISWLMDAKIIPAILVIIHRSFLVDFYILEDIAIKDLYVCSLISYLRLRVIWINL